MNWFPVGTKTRSSACGTATDTSRSETAPPAGVMRCSAPARLYLQMLHFASLTEILSLRYRLSVFLSPQKEKLRKRKTAQGVPPRSEPRFTPADRDEIKSRGSMRLRPPRPPGERASRESQTTEMLCTAEKVHVFRAKNGKGGTLSFGI